ncbi:MAG TPA: SH3 domain-containing protein [Propionibacteriaceae bacterium]|nr:SH3 domain-containing protein [Propionibacteriaceae bacterium]
MSRPRPRRAMRPPLAARVARIAIPTAVVTALGVGVAGAVMPGDGPQVAYPAPATTVSVESSPSGTSERTREPSRRVTRAPVKIASVAKPKASASETMTPKLSLKVVDSKYATTQLNVRTQPSADSSVVGTVSKGTKLSVTRTISNGFRYISYRGKGRWVKNQYLSDTKPKSTTAISSNSSGSGGISGAPCPSGSSVEDGLTPDAIRVHRAVCHRYPQVRSFLGVRSSSGFHGEGRALDCMISDSSVGWDLAKWVRANARSLGVMEVIYRQQIWTVQRSSEGWRSMSDRGSPTANHMDHVHVSVYGNSGTA